LIFDYQRLPTLVVDIVEQLNCCWHDHGRKGDD
jgi:hypothetical protein